MTQAILTQIINETHPDWDQDSKDFYFEFISQLPIFGSLLCLALGINLKSGFTDENNSNITILQFENPIEYTGTQQIYDYINQYVGEDINDYLIETNRITIDFQY